MRAQLISSIINIESPPTQEGRAFSEDAAKIVLVPDNLDPAAKEHRRQSSEVAII
jgi:hypothetical protein